VAGLASSSNVSGLRRMAYGINQCRVCGKDIAFVGIHAQRNQEEANKKSVLPEKEWRRRGYLAPPTRVQLSSAPATGCCHECGMREMDRKFKYTQRSILFALFVFCVIATGVFVITYLPH
jgi:hypothetical protein